MSENLKPGDVLDGYEIVRQIGAGGFGTVWLCRTQSMGDCRALKFISGANREVLQKELDALVRYRQAAGQLRSPHLMPIEHVNTNTFGLFYVMPLADGFGADDPTNGTWRPRTLASLIEHRRSETNWFSGEEIISLIRPVLEGLQTLLDAGLVHRDVKPDNILFLDGHPCLADISLLGEDAHLVTRRGTPGYSAPSWYVDAGGHADMYGAAATLFSLLTGNAPDKMGRPHFRWPPQGEASLSAKQHEEWLRIHRIILRGTEERPANRFLTYTAFIAALEGSGEKQGSVTAIDAGSAGGTSDRAGRLFGSSRLFTFGAFALALFSLLGTVGLLNSGFVDAYVPFAAIAIPFVGLLLSLIGIRSRLRDLNLAALLINAILLAIALYSNWPLFRQAPVVQESSPLPHPSPGSLTEVQKADYKATATLAAVYFDQKNYQSALDLVNQLTATYPVAAKNSIYSTLRARCLFALGRKEEAHAELRKSLSDMPVDTGSFGDRMQLWESLGDLEGAEAEATRAIKEERPITLYYLLRGKIRLLRQNFAGVEEDIHAASTLDNDPARANMATAMRAGFAESSPAYAEYLGARGIVAPKRSSP